MDRLFLEQFDRTFDIINSCHAHQQGRFVHHSILLKLGLRQGNAAMETLKPGLERINDARQRMWTPKAIMTDQDELQTQKMLLHDVVDLVKAMHEAAYDMVLAQRSGRISLDFPTAVESVGCLGWAAHAQEHSIRGVIRYGEMFNTELADRYRQHLDSCERAIAEVATLLSALTSPEANASTTLREVEKATDLTAVFLLEEAGHLARKLAEFGVAEPVPGITEIESALDLDI